MLALVAIPWRFFCHMHNTHCRRIVVSLGSNIGPRDAHIANALAFLRTLHEGEMKKFRVSTISETAPIGCAPETPVFLNAVAAFDSSLPAHALLDALLAYETTQGRPATREKNTPRTIDLDLLFCGTEHHNDERLVLPHPRIEERPFLQAMLAEIDEASPSSHFDATDAVDAVDSVDIN